MPPSTTDTKRARWVGIDLGGTAIKAGAVDDVGNVAERRSVPTELERGAEHVLDKIAALARELGAAGRIGVGAPGLIDPSSGTLVACPNLKALEGRALARELAQRVPHAQIVVLNDANAAALGEHWLGAGRGVDDLLLVTLGTGVGGGLILGGALQCGSGGMAGEIGHVVVDPNGRVCGCGARGCVETLASASAAERRAKERGLPRSAPGDLAALADAARRAPGVERELLFEIGRDLGRALGVVVSLLDLRHFVLGGGFGAATDVLEPGVRAGIALTSYGHRQSLVRIVPATLGGDAGWIGAARASAGVGDDTSTGTSARTTLSSPRP